MTNQPPESTSADILVAAPADHAWVIVHSRPRAEKQVVAFCGRSGIATYLPLRRKVHRYGARERAYDSPLFPGYVFCRTDAQTRSLLRQNRHVANLLEVLEQAKLIDQLRQIRTALAVGDVLEVMPFLEAGHRVKILHGPLKGLEGIVLRIKGSTRIVLNVDMIRQSVAMEVDSAWLGPG